MGAAFVAVSWNLQGSRGVDVPFVATVLRDRNPDLVALQEVPRVRARALAARLGWNVTWAFKHAPLVTRREGLALLSPHALTDIEVVILRRAVPISWKRRVALVARCRAPQLDVRVACVHLSPHDRSAERRSETGVLLQHLARSPSVAGGPSMIVGDLNVAPAGEIDRLLTEQGWSDCWDLAPAASRGGDGATNWSPGARAGRRPDQRLDYVYWRPRPDVLRASVPTETSDAFAPVSDHVPLTVEVRAR